MFVAVDGRFAGIIAVADTVKAGSREAVEKLHRLGLEVVMLTGDNQRTAEAMARQVRIDRVLADVLPKAKPKPSRTLQAKERPWPWWVTASTMRRSGAGRCRHCDGHRAPTWRWKPPTSLWCAGDLNGVVSSIALSKATVKNIKQNCSSLLCTTCWASRSRRCALSVTGWLLSPIFASLAMALSSVSVVTNALRLRGFKVSGTLCMA
jgi:Cu+-exporting ATPase